MIRDSAFRRSPLLLLAAALVALAVVLVGDSRPASAEHAGPVTVWSATLTVQDIIGQFKGCQENEANDCSAALTDDSFTYAGVSYQVIRVFVETSTDELIFSLDKVFLGDARVLDDLTLIVDGQSFPLASAASRGRFDDGDQAEWVPSGLSWSVGDTVSLSLTAPPIHPEVTLSASPNPVTPVNDPADPDLKKAYVTITATLSSPLTETVWIPVTVSALSADPNADHGTISTIGINPNELTGTAQIRVWEDVNTDDDYFQVVLDSANLPSSVIAGSPSYVTVTINDSDTAAAPGGVSNFSVTPKVRHLLLSWNKPTGRITHYEAQFKTASAPDQMGDAPVNGRVDPTTGWIAMPKWSALKTDGPATASTTDNTSGRITVLPNGLTAGTAYDVRCARGEPYRRRAVGDWAGDA